MPLCDCHLSQDEECWRHCRKCPCFFYINPSHSDLRLSLLLPECPINGILQCAALCLTSGNDFQICPYFVWIRGSFSFINRVAFRCMDIPQFVRSPVDVHCSCLHFFTTNKTLSTLVWNFFAQTYVPILPGNVMHMFNMLGKIHSGKYTGFYTLGVCFIL